MKSRDNISTSGPIPFPKSSRGEVSPPTDKDRAIAREHDAEIRELCRDTALALQGLRHGIANVFRDTLEKMDLDVWTLVQLLDERPSVVQDLIDGEFDTLTTEMMIDYLEKLRR
jgi:hypothetical protein